MSAKMPQTTRTYTVDLADEEAVDALLDEIRTDGRRVRKQALDALAEQVGDLEDALYHATRTRAA